MSEPPLPRRGHRKQTVAMFTDLLLPRELSPEQGREGVTLLHNLFTGIHLDRREARAMGWRGFLPSSAGAFTWTAKVANSDWIYGVLYVGEEADRESFAASFAIYAFPSEASLIEHAPQSMKDSYAKPSFYQEIRELAKNFSSLEAFRLAQMTIALRLDKQGLAVSIETLRRIPGVTDKTLRPIRIVLPFFSCLASSFASILREEARIFWFKGADVYLEASFGEPVFEDDGKLEKVLLKQIPLAYRQDEIDKSDKPLIHILCGFLGAGKTTFLQNWLAFLHSRERFTGVIQNEFGEVDLDAAIIGTETKVEGLNEGCICCSLADSLRPGILRLIETTPADQIILETTGLANPDNVLHSLDDLKDIVNLGLVVTVVDAINVIEHPQYLKEELRAAQIDRADVLICSKVEVCDKQQVHRLEHTLREMNPQAMIMFAEKGSTNFAALDTFFNYWLDKKYGEFTSRKRDPEHDKMLLNNCGFRLKPSKGALYETYLMKFTEPVALDEIKTIIESSGKHVLRAKGVVDVKDKGRCEVQFTDGIMTISSLRDDISLKEDGLTIIGQGLVSFDSNTQIRKERCL